MKLGRERAAAKNVVEDLEDLEDEELALKGLPSRFSELGPQVGSRVLSLLVAHPLMMFKFRQHFPLFISFDSLLLLLEGDYNLRGGKTKVVTAGQKQAFKRIKHSTADELDITAATDDDFAEDASTGETILATSKLWKNFVDLEVFDSWFSGFDQRTTKVSKWNRFLIDSLIHSRHH